MGSDGLVRGVAALQPHEEERGEEMVVPRVDHLDPDPFFSFFQFARPWTLGHADSSESSLLVRNKWRDGCHSSVYAATCDV